MNLSNETWPDEEEEEALYEPPLSLVVFLSLCYGSISIAAVVGNGLVIWVILTSRRMRNVTNYYIANLALADIVIGLFAIPFEFQAALLQRWVLPHFLCPFCPFVKVLSISVSVLTLSAIALDRYRAIMHPLTARVSRLQFRLVVSVIWIASGLMAAPMAYALRVIPHPYIKNNENESIYFCAHEKLSSEAMQWYHSVLVLLQYFIPLTVIIFAYARMGLTLWGATAPGNAQSERDANIMRNKKKVIKMLVIVVVLFALCWLPLQTYNVLQNITAINEMLLWIRATSEKLSYIQRNESKTIYVLNSLCQLIAPQYLNDFEVKRDKPPNSRKYKYINILWFGFDWLAMSNSCYNPFIYAIYNEKFKREFQVRLQTPCLKKRHRSAPLTRELSGFESSRSEWKRKSTMKNGMLINPATITLH